MISYIMRGTQAKGIWEGDFKVNIWLKNNDNAEWRMLHNDELRSLFLSPNLVKVTKYRRLKWVGHVATIGKDRSAIKILMVEHKGKRPLGKLGIDGRTLLEWILKMWEVI